MDDSAPTPVLTARHPEARRLPPATSPRQRETVGYLAQSAIVYDNVPPVGTAQKTEKVWINNYDQQIETIRKLHKKLKISNMTDEENWQPLFEGGYFGATLVMPNVPRHAQVTMQYAF